jgi:hypothetical protein
MSVKILADMNPAIAVAAAATGPMARGILVDMNLSPDRVPVPERHGWSAVHWSAVGDPRATDRALMDWAVANRYIPPAGISWSASSGPSKMSRPLTRCWSMAGPPGQPTSHPRMPSGEALA